jgi:hypothetical protein
MFLLSALPPVWVRSTCSAACKVPGKSHAHQHGPWIHFTYIGTWAALSITSSPPPPPAGLSLSLREQPHRFFFTFSSSSPLPWSMDAVGRQSTRCPSHHGRQPEALVAMAEQQRSSDQWRLETCGKRQAAGFDQTQMLSNRRVATTGACPHASFQFKVLVVMKLSSSICTCECLRHVICRYFSTFPMCDPNVYTYIAYYFSVSSRAANLCPGPSLLQLSDCCRPIYYKVARYGKYIACPFACTECTKPAQPLLPMCLNMTSLLAHRLPDVSHAVRTKTSDGV